MNGAIAGDEGVRVMINVKREKPEQKIMVVVEEESVRAQTMRVGADVAVLKPITAESIVQKVNDMLMSKGSSFRDRKRAKFQRRK